MMIVRLRDSHTGPSAVSYAYDPEAGKIGESRHVNVYVAQCISAGKEMPVVIKVPKSANSIENERLRRQADIDDAGGLLPHTIEAITVSEKDNTEKCILILEYVPGITLTQFICGNLKSKFEDVFVNVQSLHNRYLVDRNRIACFILKSIAEAIRAMHDKGLCHGELTSDDVLITAQGAIRLTTTGNAHSNGNMADDIFRIGVIAYQLATADTGLDVLDTSNIATIEMSDFVETCLDGSFTNMSAVCQALDAMTTFTTKSQGFLKKRKGRKFNIDPVPYGVYIPSKEDDLKVEIEREETKRQETKVAEAKARKAEEERRELEARKAEKERREREAKKAEEERREREAKKAEEERREREARKAEEERREREARKAEEERREREAKMAEAQRLAEKQLEQERKRAAALLAEERRKTEEKLKAERQKAARELAKINDAKGNNKNKQKVVVGIVAACLIAVLAMIVWYSGRKADLEQDVQTSQQSTPRQPATDLKKLPVSNPVERVSPEKNDGNAHVPETDKLSKMPSSPKEKAAPQQSKMVRVRKEAKETVKKHTSVSTHRRNNNKSGDNQIGKSEDNVHTESNRAIGL